MTSSRQARFDTTGAHPARVYDFWLGGKDNFEADRVAARQVVLAQPGILYGVRASDPAGATAYIAAPADVVSSHGGAGRKP